MILDETIWSLTSPLIKRISGSKNFRSSPQKDFCNNIPRPRCAAKTRIVRHFKNGSTEPFPINGPMRTGQSHRSEVGMNRYEARLREMGVTLPTLPKPLANYVPAKRSGNLVFTAGQVSSANGVEYIGKLGDSFAVADAQAATRASVINCLAAIKAQIGSLDFVASSGRGLTR